MLAVQLALCIVCSSTRVCAQRTLVQLVNEMGQNERAALRDSRRFTYISEERSARTGGHLWTEKVVETKDGLFRRLIAEDGKPLASGQAKAEEQHLAYLVAHPEAFRRLNQDRKDDQERAGDLLRMLPTAFLFEDGDIENGCERIAFRPDPHFQPATFEQRVLHAMAGTVLMSSNEKRLCGIDAQVEHEVDFAFGLLGKVNRGGKFSITRGEVSPGSWKTNRLDVHIDGRLLLMKSISHDEVMVHSDFKQIPDGLSLAEANALSRP